MTAEQRLAIRYDGRTGFEWYRFCVDKSLEFHSASVEHLWWWALRYLLDEPDWWGYWRYKVSWHMGRYGLPVTPKPKRERVRPKVKRPKTRKLRGRPR